MAGVGPGSGRGGDMGGDDFIIHRDPRRAIVLEMPETPRGEGLYYRSHRSSDWEHTHVPLWFRGGMCYT